MSGEMASCPYCLAGEPSVWDDVLFHYAHPAGDKLKMCHHPWRDRCRRCSASITQPGVHFYGRRGIRSGYSTTGFCALCDPNYRCTCLRHDQGFGTECHTYACARRNAEADR